jgi:hypothetical protein
MIPNEKLRLGSVYVSASQQVQVAVAAHTTIGALAASMSQLDSTLSAHTLELAAPLPRRQRLGDLALANGDRLLLLANTPKQLPTPDLFNTTDTALRFFINGQQVPVGGKSGYLVGASQRGSDVTPDIDLRQYVPSTLADFIAEGCVWLQYDGNQHQWFASRIGNTRVKLDEYELQGDKFPLAKSVTLRLFPQGATFIGTDRLLAEVNIRQEGDPRQISAPQVQAGDHRVRVVLGVEQSLGLVDASPNMGLQTVADALLKHANIAQPTPVQAFSLRLLSSQDTVGAALQERESFLYVARSVDYVRSALRLRGIGQTKAQYDLVGARSDERRTLGCRAHPTLPDNSLDIDLYDWLPPKEDALLPHIGRTWATLEFVAENREWWLRPSDVPMPLFVNERRVSAVPVRLLDDSLLSIGFEGSQWVLRFAVEIHAPR